MTVDDKVGSFFEVKHKLRRDSAGVHFTSELYRDNRLIDSKGAYKDHDDPQSDESLEGEHVSFFADGLTSRGHNVRIQGNRIYILK